jgi:hypothetical protein
MNIFNLPPLPLPEELTTILAESDGIRIERIISTGQVSDWYDQAEILALQKLAYQENAARYNDPSIPPLTQTLDELMEELKRYIILKAAFG